MKLRVALIVLALFAGAAFAADHNDPSSVNSIFSDVPLSATDLYDLFGWPADDKRGGDRVVLAMTFAPVPRAGVFDHDMLYRIRIHADRRVAHDRRMNAFEDFLQYVDAVGRKYLQWRPAEVRVTTTVDNQARIEFIGFPCASFSRTVAMDQPLTLQSPGGKNIQVYIGGRDDAFFNDLPGLFRSINYAPQYYQVSLGASHDLREMKIPKTLIELEGISLFNHDSTNPNWGRPGGIKKDLPSGGYTWTGNRYYKNANGNYRFGARLGSWRSHHERPGREHHGIVFLSARRLDDSVPQRPAWYRTRFVVPTSAAIAATGLIWTVLRIVRP